MTCSYMLPIKIDKGAVGTTYCCFHVTGGLNLRMISVPSRAVDVFGWKSWNALNCFGFGSSADAVGTDADSFECRMTICNIRTLGGVSVAAWLDADSFECRMTVCNIRALGGVSVAAWLSVTTWNSKNRKLTR